MSFVIAAETTKVFKSGSFVEETVFFVKDDQSGAIVSKKVYGTQEEAQEELSGLQGLEVGMLFAQSAFPDLGQKGQVGKANVVAEYLAWEAASRPVKEAKPVADGEEAPAEAPQPDETF
ncbi:hypothetical protein vBAspATola_37 [Aeromonas phage vB_AspA_Tola]|nr:hypothetical protein vBAspATola_37 [Aeromonas phage vB_AspA_Tola]